MHEIDENLQDFVFVSRGLGHGGVLAHDLNPMAGEAGRVELQGIIHQVGDGHVFEDAGNAGVILLHGDDFLDVLNVARQLILFAFQERVFWQR